MKGDYRVYIAGPMTGLPDFNYPAFFEAERGLESKFGWKVLNPAKHFNGDQTLPREVYLYEAVKSVLKADAIVLLEGWERSPGALTELAVAKAIGLDVFDKAGNEVFADVILIPVVGEEE